MVPSPSAGSKRPRKGDAGREDGLARAQRVDGEVIISGAIAHRCPAAVEGEERHADNIRRFGRLERGLANVPDARDQAIAKCIGAHAQGCGATIQS
jgi:hypothetical protein